MGLSEEVEEELTCLESILLDTISVDRKCGDKVKVDLKLGPLTASDDELMYVGMVLSLTLSQNYPERSPGIEIKSPRGLSEDQVDFMTNEMKGRCVAFSGSPVIFELVNFCQEYLTEQNVPSCPCPICLSSLEPYQEFCKTACYHYFHSFCLGKYYKSVEDSINVICPVCREDISSMNFGKLCQAEEPQESKLNSEEEIKYVAMAKSTQRKLQVIFEKQLKSGSIIDTEAEKTRRLISIAGSQEPSGPSVPVRLQPPPAPRPEPENDQKHKKRHQKKNHHGRQRGHHQNNHHHNKHHPQSS